MYDGSGETWAMGVVPISSSLNQDYWTFSVDKFLSIDLSLAGQYVMEITDSNGSVTTFNTFKVAP